jgi:hypothetical protein
MANFRYVMFFILYLASIKVSNAQFADSTAIPLDTSINTIDTTSAPTFQWSRRDIQQWIKIIKESNELRKTIQAEYEDLLVLKGFHPSVGYVNQGLHTFSIGLGYGKRHLFSPGTYKNYHSQLLFYNGPTKTHWGMGLGYTKSSTLGFWGIEGFLLPNGSGQYNVALRPEIGIGLFGTFELGYGFNIGLDKNNSSLSTHSFVIRYTHQFLQKSITQKVKQINHVFTRDYQRLKSLGLDLKSGKKKK